MPEKRMMFTGWSMQGILAGRKIETRRPADKPPRYAVGDMIVILERWRIASWKERIAPVVHIEYEADSLTRRVNAHAPAGNWWFRMWEQSRRELRAANVPTGADGCFDWDALHFGFRWRLPRYLPTACARPERLTVTAVHAEPLHAITLNGCIAEGVPWNLPDPMATYRSVWEGIHGPGSWRKNPDVYVYAFTNPFEKGA